MKMKKNRISLWTLVFDLCLLIGCIYHIYSIQTYTAEEMIGDLQAVSSERIKRNRFVSVFILDYLGKEGYYIFVGVCFIIIFKYRFLPNLRKFLGKEVEKKEENEE
ncbi:hypothetical protein CAPN004_11490 [Capnocytophaga cynodegmi]|nr:hypothetical protein CAPN004_11490 [Capnocytophaga cynodegmi]